MRDQVFKKGDSDPRLYGIEFMLVDVDDQSGFPHYYGYVAFNGSYYIMRELATGSVAFSKKEFGARGSYSQSWQGRTGLSYTPWDTTF